MAKSMPPRLIWKQSAKRKRRFFSRRSDGVSTVGDLQPATFSAVCVKLQPHRKLSLSLFAKSEKQFLQQLWAEWPSVLHFNVEHKYPGEEQMCFALAQPPFSGCRCPAYAPTAGLHPKGMSHGWHLGGWGRCCSRL